MSAAANEDFLQGMATASRARAEAAKAEVSESTLLEIISQLPPPPPLRLHGGFDLIAEMKLRSPAVGQLKAAQDNDIGARVMSYAEGGAAAVSVLTEPSRFDGHLEHLASASWVLQPMGVPAMRKDFLVDPYQVLEARAYGAGGVLIIISMLSRTQLDELCAAAREQGLFVLLEAFDEADIALSHDLVAGWRTASDPTVAAPQVLVGINSRDLRTLKVVPGRLEPLAHLLPKDFPRVAESGVGSAQDAARMAAAGYDLALVGSALMTGGDPRALAHDMIEAGRAACSGRHQPRPVFGEGAG